VSAGCVGGVGEHDANAERTEKRSGAFSTGLIDTALRGSYAALVLVQGPAGAYSSVSVNPGEFLSAAGEEGGRNFGGRAATRAGSSSEASSPSRSRAFSPVSRPASRARSRMSEAGSSVRGGAGASQAGLGERRILAQGCLFLDDLFKPGCCVLHEPCALANTHANAPTAAPSVAVAWAGRSADPAANPNAHAPPLSPLPFTSAWTPVVLINSLPVFFSGLRVFGPPSADPSPLSLRGREHETCPIPGEPYEIKVVLLPHFPGDEADAGAEVGEGVEPAPGKVLAVVKVRDVVSPRGDLLCPFALPRYLPLHPGRVQLVVYGKGPQQGPESGASPAAGRVLRVFTVRCAQIQQPAVFSLPVDPAAAADPLGCERPLCGDEPGPRSQSHLREG
jgi:hypothetical protein